MMNYRIRSRDLEGGNQETDNNSNRYSPNIKIWGKRGVHKSEGSGPPSGFGIIFKQTKLFLISVRGRRLTKDFVK